MSKQKMRGVFAIVLSVVMLLGSVSMGVFAAEDADPAYTIAYTTGYKTLIAEENSLPEGKTATNQNQFTLPEGVTKADYFHSENKYFPRIIDEAIDLKAGQKMYIVLDPFQKDPSGDEAWFLMTTEEWAEFFLSISKADGTAVAKFSRWEDVQETTDINECGFGLKFGYSITEIDSEDWFSRAWVDENAKEHLLDNYAEVVRNTEVTMAGQNPSLQPETLPEDASNIRVGVACGNGQLITGCYDGNDEDEGQRSQDYIARAVLEFTAPEDGKYTIDAFAKINAVTYVLTEKLPETPAPGGDDACTHEDATEVAGTAKEPTCTEPGKEANKECTCGVTITGKEIPALGHNFGEGKDEPLCSVCKARNPDYVYVPSGPYYKLTASQYVNKSAIKEADLPADAEKADYEFSDGKYYPLAVNQKITLKKGEVAYIVIDPTDENGDLVSNVNQLEWYMHIHDTTGFEVATFQREQSGGLGIGREQTEHGLTFAYSYTDRVNWTKETSNNLLLDNYTELVFTSINKVDRFDGQAMCWVAPEGKPGDDMQVGIINGHGKPHAEVNDDYITRLVLAFEAPADDEYTISAYAAGTANVRFLQTAKAPAGTTPGGSTPATGVDTFVWPVALVALVTMATGVVLCTKKSRAK